MDKTKVLVKITNGYEATDWIRTCIWEFKGGFRLYIPADEYVVYKTSKRTFLKKELPIFEAAREACFDYLKNPYSVHRYLVHIAECLEGVQK